MNRVTKRTWLMSLLVLTLVGGMFFFLWEYALRADEWVIAQGSPHVYNNGNLGCGTVTDRSGAVLLDVNEQRKYSADETTRKSTLHWLGDRKGYINASAIAGYAAKMTGFDLVDGLYSSSGQGGEAKLTLSAKVQNVAYAAMAGRKGTVAVYNYKTGEILCAVTTPSFDPDNVPDIQDGDEAYEGVYINRFLQSTYIPGSIYKVVTTAAALSCVPDIRSRTFHCEGIREYGSEKVSCETVHGTQDIQAALANSCNCAFSEIAELVGRDNMNRYVEQFQVVESLEFGGVSTAKGNYDISQAGAVSFAWSCIGQYTDMVNPARFMTFMGAIAGDGVAAEPYLVSSVRSDGETTYKAKTQKMDRIMSEEVASQLRAYLRNNVKSKYGDWNFPGLAVCAKSGTSQLGGDKVSNAMFAGFVDSEEYPLAFMVVVENGGYGMSACVPVISQVLAACKTEIDSE